MFDKNVYRLTVKLGDWKHNWLILDYYIYIILFINEKILTQLSRYKLRWIKTRLNEISNVYEHKSYYQTIDWNKFALEKKRITRF